MWVQTKRTYFIAASSLGGGCGLVELVDELADEPFNLVTDRADLLERQTLGIGEMPVQTSDARGDGADFFAAGRYGV